MANVFFEYITVRFRTKIQELEEMAVKHALQMDESGSEGQEEPRASTRGIADEAVFDKSDEDKKGHEASGRSLRPEPVLNPAEDPLRAAVLGGS